MAEEDPLQYLKDRIKEDANRRSRAAALPLDNTPETYMGASVKELAGERSEEEDPKRLAPSVSPARRRSSRVEEEPGQKQVEKRRETKVEETRKTEEATGNSEAEVVSGEDELTRKPRVKKLDRSRARQPSLVTKILSQDVSIPLDEKERKGEERHGNEEQVAKDLNVTTAVTSSREEGLKEEIAQLEDQLEEATEQLEDYDVLCERLLGGKKPSARNLAIYIGELRDAVEDAEGYKEKLRTTSGELVLLKADMDTMQKQTESAKEELRQLRSELEVAQTRLATVEADKGVGERTADDEERLRALEAALASRDEELTRLRNELAELKEMPSSLEEEAALYRQAEEDLEAMETMLREQEEFMARLEADMEKNLQALPPSLREAFLKEKERMLASLGERVTDKEEERVEEGEEKEAPSTNEDLAGSLEESASIKSGSPSPKTASPKKSPSPSAGEEVRSGSKAAPAPEPAMKSFAAVTADTTK